MPIHSAQISSPGNTLVRREEDLAAILRRTRRRLQEHLADASMTSRETDEYETFVYPILAARVSICEC